MGLSAAHKIIKKTSVERKNDSRTGNSYQNR